MAFMNNNTGTTKKSSAGSDLNGIVKCSKDTCRFNIEGDKCSLEYCFYEDTEWKLSQETFEFECQICNEKTTGDSKNADMRICNHCLERIKEMGTVTKCKLCTGDIDPKKITLWGTGICDICAIRLKSVLNNDGRRCPLCGKNHKAMPLPLTNICSQCVTDLKEAIRFKHTHY